MQRGRHGQQGVGIILLVGVQVLDRQQAILIICVPVNVHRDMEKLLLQHINVREHIGQYRLRQVLHV